MKIWDRYILKQFLLSFVFTLLLIVLVIILLDVTDKNESFIKHQLSYGEIFGYYQSFLPFMTNMVMPITVFITTVFVTSRLAQRMEIIAALSGGISFVRLLLPYAIGATLITLGSFLLTGWWLADANKKRVIFETTYIDHPVHSNTRQLHIRLSADTYLYIGHYLSHRGIGTDVTLETIRDHEMVDKLSAERMEWVPETGQWRFRHWLHRRFDGLEEHITQGHMWDKKLNLNPDDFVINPKLHETLTLPQLHTHIQKLKSRGMDNVHIFLTERYVRFMSPFAAIILTFMGVVIAARRSRGGVGLQIAFGFFLALVYIAMFLFARGTAEVKGHHLLLTVWTPNIIFFLISCYLYRWVPK